MSARFLLSPCLAIACLGFSGLPHGSQSSASEDAQEATGAPAAATSTIGASKFALLIGCTVYPALNERFHLVGPGNDVVLAKQMLSSRFGFPEQHIVVLADHVGDPEHLPTRANIEREWQRLADVADQGHQIFVLMAGHGTQAPQQGDDDGDDEVDGLDEMFLPRDVKNWNDMVGEVENGIKDDEIREWVDQIRSKGAHLWVVIDACHSGTMTRDLGDEVRRELNPEVLGIPSAVLAKAQSREAGPDAANESQLFSDNDGEQSRGIGSEADRDEPVFMALFASQSSEPTVEKRLPRLGKDREYYGLLTYTTNQVLAQADFKMTYRELVQRIHQQYIQWGRVSPTPILEGNGLDREVLGLEIFPERATLLVSGNRRTGFHVNAGTLAGITPDSILAVYPAAGETAADEVLGHVRVLTADPIEATIEPCEHEGQPVFEKLAAGMRCGVVYHDLGDQRLRVGIDTYTEENQELPAAVIDEMKRVLADQFTEVVMIVDDPADADWLVRLDSLASKRLFLTPVSGWHGKQAGELPPLFGPAPEGDERVVWLETSLQKIARVQALLRISGGGGVGWGDPTKIKTEIVHFKDASDRTGTPLKFERGGIKLYNGDQVGFRVTNTGDEPLDVTVLLIDSSFGIHSLYPQPGNVNRLYPGNQVVRRGSITADTTGLEHLVVLAVRGTEVGTPLSFAGLSQATIERTRAAGHSALDSPLGKILRQGLFGPEGGEQTRGFAAAEVEKFHTQTVSWTTIAARREAATPPDGSE